MVLFYQPQVLLFQTTSGNYFLHSVTYVDRIDIGAGGYKIAKKLSKNGSLKVELYAIQEDSLRNHDIRCINPIVHRIELEQSFDEEEIKIDARFYIQKKSNLKSRTGKPVRRKAGSSFVRAVSSFNHTRPKPIT